MATVLMIRGKQMLEGSMMGGAVGLIEGLVLARGLKGMRNATEYIPSNERSAAYFAKNKPENLKPLKRW